jgi:uncharacterized protein YciI
MADINVTINDNEVITTTITLAEVAMIPTAAQVTTDTSAFSGNLSAADTTVQKALDTIDDMATGATSVTVSNTPSLNLFKSGIVISGTVIPVGINHNSLLNSGTNPHTTIDAHLINVANPHSVTSLQVLPTQTGNLNKYLKTDGAGTVSWDLPYSGTGSTGAPTDATYVVLSANGSLSDERILTAGRNIVLTDAGAGSTITIEAWSGTDATKEPVITAGLNTQYWRGDKSWQILNSAAVGLGNVENTALSTWIGSTNLYSVKLDGSTLSSSASGLKVTNDYSLSTHRHDSLYIGLITSGTVGQYLRGDYTFQTLDKTAVGLGNVANTAQVTSVTGSLPISSSGGTTPNITISSGSSTQNGYLLSNDYVRFNAKLDTTGNGSGLIGLTKAQVGLTSVEDTALSTWGGSGNIATVGNITVGFWSGTVVPISKGGTGQITANAALNALLPAQTGKVSYNLQTDGSNTSWVSGTGGAGSDSLKVKVSSDDTTENYLELKLSAGPNITLTTLSPGGDESIQIQAWSGTDSTKAPVASAYVTIGQDATLSAERALTAGPNITITDAGANSTVTIQAWSGTDATKAPISAAFVTIGNDATLSADRALTAGANIVMTDGGANGAVTLRAYSGTDTNYNAKFILQVADTTMPNAQSLGLLTTGLVKNTTTTGVLSIGLAGTDYESPLTFSYPLVRATNTITAPFASATVSGTLKSADFVTFNNKAPNTPSYLTLASDEGLTAERILTAGPNVTFTDNGAGSTLIISAYSGSGGSGAPTNVSYLTLGLDATLSAERVLTAGPCITFTDSGANGTLLVSAWSGTGSATNLAALTDVSITSPAANQILIYSGTKWGNPNLVLDTMISPQADVLLSAIGVSFTNNSAILKSGTTVSLSVPYNCSIMQWDAFSLNSGTFVADVKKATYANYPTMSSIAGTDKPTLTASTYKGQSTALTGWTLAVSVGDVIKFDIEQATQSGTVTTQLKVRKT